MDWVKAYFDCSVDHVWIALRERVKADFEEWQRRSQDSAITLSEDGDNRLLVTRSSAGKQWVTVEKTDKGLQSRTNMKANQGPPLVKTFSPIVNRHGKCGLLHNSKELEFWQVSRLVLLPLLMWL